MKLNQFLKIKSLVSTGGQAKQMINSGLISVNGIVETRRGRQLRQGDRVSFEHEDYIVSHADI
tara:strand:- start:118 stop:306 length:189 start_codon:yes stop_codon:yes gene_type:complete